MDSQLHDLIIQLHDHQAIQFREVTLKTGVVSPVYVDLRVLVSYPKLLASVASLMWEKTGAAVSSFDVICGVPYTALPFASVMSVTNNVPMVMKRKEGKSYGTKKMIEGSFREGDTALIIEDVLTSGTSVIETVNCLLHSKLKVTDAVILLDRNQGGIENLRQLNVKAHCLLTMDQVTQVLVASAKIDEETRDRLTAWLLSHPSRISKFALNEYRLMTSGLKNRKTFEERAKMSQENGLTARICDIISRKRSNLCVALDLESGEEVLKMASLLAPFICILKLHVDVLTDFSLQDFVYPLQRLSQEHDFVIFEDRKFADIGNTVKLQYEKGIHRINQWADLVTCHVIAGPDTVTALKASAKEGNIADPRGCLLIAELSSQQQLLGKTCIEAAFSVADKNPDFVVGFICQNRITDDPRFLHFTPGVSLISKGDSLGQQYRSPLEAISSGADVIICGRSITSSENPAEEAEKIRKEAFHAYMTFTH